MRGLDLLRRAALIPILMLLKGNQTPQPPIFSQVSFGTHHNTLNHMRHCWAPEGTVVPININFSLSKSCAPKAARDVTVNACG